jgi:hypothetical protein
MTGMLTADSGVWLVKWVSRENLLRARLSSLFLKRYGTNQEITLSIYIYKTLE